MIDKTVVKEDNDCVKQFVCLIKENVQEKNMFIKRKKTI